MGIGIEATCGTGVDTAAGRVIVLGAVKCGAAVVGTEIVGIEIERVCAVDRSGGAGV